MSEPDIMPMPHVSVKLPAAWAGMSTVVTALGARSLVMPSCGRESCDEHALSSLRSTTSRATCSSRSVSDSIPDPSGFPGCCNPTNVALGRSGRVYVTEKAGPRAKVLDSEGKLVSVIATSVFDPNCKNMAVAADGRGRVFVVDTERLHIVVYEPVATGEESAADTGSRPR